MMQCPYNKGHIVTEKKLERHLRTKHRKQHAEYLKRNHEEQIKKIADQAAAAAVASIANDSSSDSNARHTYYIVLQ
ncbi:hypothetical protein FQR65_LT07672 [Abscondita terminalis]|nr:hypothetical protein FQR65_LT07672 [Abscondita terminalis]